MGDVYRTATKVVVWLGPAENDSDLAMESLSGLGADLSTIPRPISAHELEEYGLPDENSPVWHAVGHLFRRQWFGRLWTFQEAVLAAELIVVSGQKMADWKLIAKVAERLWNGCIAAANVGWARNQLIDSKELPAIDLLDMVSHKTCLDPRDRVYAILGMTSFSFRNRIEISYSDGIDQHIWRTFIECAKACIEEGQVRILELVAGRERISDLPSWCPDFRSNPADLALYSSHKIFSAGITRESSSSKTTSIKTSRESDTLRATGFRVDVVSEVVDGYFDWPNVQQGVQLRQRAQRFVEWESRRAALAQKTLSLPANTIPLAHMFTLSSSTQRWWFERHNASDSDLLKAYLHVLQIITNVALDAGTYLGKRTELGVEVWHRICEFNQGRRYFSTENGRLGLGPPEIQKGDTMCVFYGTETVMLLRPTRNNPGDWYFVGDAFVHGLMELDETPQSARGADEIFTIT